MGSAGNVQTVKLLLALACTRGFVSLESACSFLLGPSQLSTQLPAQRAAWADALLAAHDKVTLDKTLRSRTI